MFVRYFALRVHQGELWSWGVVSSLVNSPKWCTLYIGEQIPWIYAVFCLHFRYPAGMSTGQCKHFPSVHYGDLVFRSGYLWSEGWLQYRAAGITKAYSVEVKAALPRKELVYLSGPCQLNICLRDFLQFMKKGHIEGSGGGSLCLTAAVGSCTAFSFRNSS